MTTSDFELQEQIATGSAEAFGTLFDRHATPIYNYCFRRTADWSVAEDLTSVVFLEAWKGRARLKLVDGSLLPWLYGIAANVLRNHRRALRRYERALARLPPPIRTSELTDAGGDRLAEQERMRALLDELRELPIREQSAVILCDWQGLSSVEASAVLGIPEGTVRTRLARAHRKLRATVKEHPDFERAHIGGSR